jgi:hypothetical protein
MDKFKKIYECCRRSKSSSALLTPYVRFVFVAQKYLSRDVRGPLQLGAWIKR